MDNNFKDNQNINEEEVNPENTEKADIAEGLTAEEQKATEEIEASKASEASEAPFVAESAVNTEVTQTAEVPENFGNTQIPEAPFTAGSVQTPVHGNPQYTQYQQYNPYAQPQNNPYYGQNNQAPYGQYQAPQNNYQPNPQYPNYQGYNPYPPKPPKKKLPTALKVFIVILSVLAGATVLGFAVFGIYKVSNTATQSYNDYLPSIIGGDESSEYSIPDFPYNGGNGENSEDSDSAESSASPEISQPDISVEPYTAGITISSKPNGSELSAEEAYAKVLPSTVAVTAVIQSSTGATSTGVGTGIFITENGYILTNSHVVGNTKSSGLTVTTSDGTEYPAVTVGYDKTTDIAVIKIDGTGFTPAEFGSADELNIGEWVIAIGNPGGTEFSGSLTRGVISGLNRQVGSYSSNGMTYIQTDAAINPGNSGGPLVNMYGQVVGMNSSKIVADYYEGMGFAIPISGAKSIIDELLADGYVTGRVRLGITGQNNQVSGGVNIVAINDDSSFTGTDAQVGDIITALDGKEVTSLTTLANVLLDYNPGDEAVVTLNRDGETIEVTIKLLEDKGETQK